MKTIIFFISSLLAATTLCAGSNIVVVSDSTTADTSKSVKGSRHELSIGATNLTDRLFPFFYWDYWYYWDEDYFFLSSMNMPPTYGISYKYHFTKLALRTGLDFNTDRSNIKETASSSSTPSSEKTEYRFTRFGARLGLEVKKDAGKTQWFAGGDLFYEHFNSRYEYTNTGIEDEYSFNRDSYGISPLVGVRYYVSKIISLSVESKLNMFNNIYNIAYDNFDSFPDFYTYKGSGFSMKFSPIGQIGVNVHF